MLLLSLVGRKDRLRKGRRGRGIGSVIGRESVIAPEVQEQSTIVIIVTIAVWIVITIHLGGMAVSALMEMDDRGRAVVTTCLLCVGKRRKVDQDRFAPLYPQTVRGQS